MASFSHHDRYHPQPRPRYDSHYSDQYSRPLRHDPRPDDHAPAMRDRTNPYSSSPSSSSYTSYEPRYSDSPVPPRPSSRYPPTSAYRPNTRHTQGKPWPPPPSVEDELSSLGKEFPSLAGSDADHGRGGEVKSRGSVDQYPIIEEIEQPHIPYDNDDRRFVLVSDPGADGVEPSASTPRRDHRRKSVAERGNMAHLKTDMADPPVFTERTSTPYAYTKPQKESLLPSPDEYSLSPEATHTSASSVPRSVPSRDQNATHTKAIPIHSRYDSFTQSQAQSPRAHRNDVFDDSDPESEGTTHLRTERKPARYSFVKSDLQKEDLRTSLHESQSRSDKKRQDAAASNSRGTHSGSSSSSKHSSPPYQSPRSSSSSLEDGGRRKARPPPVDPGMRDSRPSPRPSSPRYHEPPQIPPRSPKLPPRRPVDSPTTSRPPSRSGIRPPSPLSSSATFTPTSVPRVPVTETDWHSTYPPVSADRPRPPSRLNRHDSLPVPNPRIDVQSPSPARPPPRADNPLPYPVDDRPRDVYMPPEEKYQFDHSSTPVTASPRQPFLDSPKLTPSPAPVSPRERPAGSRPSANTRHSTNPEEIPRLARVRSNSIRSQSSHDGRRTERRTGPIPLSMDKPLPSCPRSEPSDKYDDWYMLENRANFDICPSCFEAVFEDTPFSVYFSQTRRYERRQDRQQRVCDFSSPWLRLAWLMTLRQRRKGFELIYAMADILETERPCPMDREISTDVCMWYGIPDLRDGLHISNFAVCPRDLKMIEALFPTVRGYFTPLPSTNALGAPNRHKCSLRTSSRRFPKYLDLLVELDTDAQTRSLHPDMARFIQLARENAFKQECNKGTPAFRKPWHFIPQLPHLTVCQECYDELVWPILKSKSTHPSSNIPNMFNRAIQLVPGEDPDAGSSCCLWSPRMRKVWAKALEYDDFKYLSRKAIERKGKDIELARERRELVEWMAGAERQSREWETGRRELRKLDAEWADFE